MQAFPAPFRHLHHLSLSLSLSLSLLSLSLTRLCHPGVLGQAKEPPPLPLRACVCVRRLLDTNHGVPYLQSAHQRGHPRVCLSLFFSRDASLLVIWYTQLLVC